MRRRTLLAFLMVGVMALLGACGTNAARRGGTGEAPSTGQQTDDSGVEAGANQPGGADADEGFSLIADLVTQTQSAPNGKAAALVVDAGQVPAVLLQIATEPCSASSSFEGLVDQVYVPEWGLDVDFIMFVIDPSIHALAPFGIPDENVTHYQALRHLDSGIGTNELPDGAVGPSSLRGYTLLGEREKMVTGVALHELGHAWAAHLTGPPVLAEQIVPSDADLDACESDRRVHHWNKAHIDGLMGGWSNLDGVCDDSEPMPYLGHRMPYAPLELYLMGLAEAEEVPPVEIYPEGVEAAYTFFEDPSDEEYGGYYGFLCVDETGREVPPEEFTAQIVTVTIEEIIEHNGPRIPAVADSPKHFRIALLVLTTETLEDADWDFYERALDFLAAPEQRSVLDSFPADLYPDFNSDLAAEKAHWGTEAQPFQNFYMATGRRATIEFVDLRSASSGP
ncbi:MAG: hypothetical protein GY778_03685 [bacterium]|nr:hypothetical protein [bacterium]